MDNTGRFWYVFFQFFCAPWTPVEPNRPPGQLQLLTQLASAEPARHHGGASRSRRRRSCSAHAGAVDLVSPTRLGTCSASASQHPAPKTPCHASKGTPSNLSHTPHSPRDQESHARLRGQPLLSQPREASKLHRNHRLVLRSGYENFCIS